MSNTRSEQSGFSYIDVLIAIVILMVGVLAMLSALTASLMRSYEAEQRIVAKQLVVSTIESVISAKEIERPGVIQGWDSMRNTTGVVTPGVIDGIFLNDFRPIREDIGADGVAGTADDACSGAGPCVTATSPPNTSRVMGGYARRIVVTDIEDPERPTPTYPIARRRVEVTVQFAVNGNIREETMATVVTNYKF